MKNTEIELKEKIGLDVVLKIKESHSLFCVFEVHVQRRRSFLSMFNGCCEADNAYAAVVEKALAMKFPSGLKKALAEQKVDADVVVCRDADRQEAYEHKVLDLLYPQLGDYDPSAQGEGILEIFNLNT